MLNIEHKEDSAEKLAAIAGKPTKNFLFAEEVNQIVQEVNNLEATINPDRLISLGTETIDVNEYTYEGYTWQLDGVQINNIGNPSIIVIPSATIGYKRNDISVFKADGTIERIAGTETNGEVVTTPDVPEGTLFYKSYSVNGNDIDAEPEPPAIDGSIYKKKIENTRWKSTQSGTDVVIPFQAAGQMHYSVVNSGLISVAGFSTANLTGPLYEGIDVLFENQTGNPITLKNMFGGISTPVKFNFGADLIVPNSGKLWMRLRNREFELIMKSWSDVKDVIEGYFNGTNFYTDALFTNLITPESSKIYLNIAVTPATQYRWSGSAYVQIGGGGDTIAYFFQGGASMPTINTWYANNVGFVINGTTTFGSGAVPSGTYPSIGALVIPAGYILEKIIFGEYFNPTGLSHDLEIVVLRGEYGIDQLSNALFNYETLVQQTLSIGYLNTSPKYYKELTIASHSAKQRSALQVYMRQKTNNSQSNYSMTFIFKKA